MMTHPSTQFANSIAANVVYWRERTENLTDDALPAIDQERQNLYKAVKFGLHLTTTWQETAELVLQAFVLVERRGYWVEWIPVMEQLLETCPEDQPVIRGRILNHLGAFYQHNRQLKKALQIHQEELALGIDTDDKWRQAHACLNLGAVYRQMRRFDEAITYILAAQKTFQDINAPLVKHAFVILELGLLAQSQRQWAEAEEHFSYATSLFREVADPVYLANSLKLLGQVLVAQNKPEDAFCAYNEALNSLSQTENQLDKTRVQNELGVLYLNQGQLDEAQQLLLLADATLRQSGNLSDQAVVALNLGNVYLALGYAEYAAQSFQRSADLWQTCDEPIQCANSLGGIAEAKTAQGKIEEAFILYEQAIDLLADQPRDFMGEKLKGRLEMEMNRLKQL